MREEERERQREREKEEGLNKRERKSGGREQCGIADSILPRICPADYLYNSLRALLLEAERG